MGQRATHAEVSPEAFKELLKPIGSKKAVVCYVVDVFDFHGSFLSDLTGMFLDDRRPSSVANWRGSWLMERPAGLMGGEVSCCVG